MEDELLINARKAIAEEKFQAAVALFEQLYATNPTSGMNHELSNAYYLNQQYEEAERIILEKLDVYLNDETNFAFLTAVFLKSESFILLRELLGSTKLSVDVKQRALDKLQQAEVKSQTELVEFQHQVLNEFYHMADQPVITQINRFQLARKLPLSDWLKGTQFLLLDPFIHPIVRASLLESIEKMKLTNQFQFYWLDETSHEIKGSELQPLSKMQSFKAMMQALDESIAKKDPILGAQLQEELRLQAMYLYPYTNKVINDPQLWVNHLVHVYDADESLPVDNLKLANIRNWQEKLQEYTKSMIDSFKNVE
ncbi:BS_ysoA related protein with TPR repeats [Secundilactobacillus oryzae JCM 18671]|uniref:BS_ysoA related protein with TPR repeats n=1 Tax=Secundilactobacillus oryzae JCM 18671 TaxID=1291743 RepID=A0A081BGT3_9LACO|nr:tetratricopeptide repeat protein [Secundilactobacillus oryzae]GAK47251.1 BS_ysoA related protein with TPR repeats [Secundilactobacillus oryzae JCM 18671]